MQQELQNNELLNNSKSANSQIQHNKCSVLGSIQPFISGKMVLKKICMYLSPAIQEMIRQIFTHQYIVTTYQEPLYSNILSTEFQYSTYSYQLYQVSFFAAKKPNVYISLTASVVPHCLLLFKSIQSTSILKSGSLNCLQATSYYYFLHKH